MISTLVPKLQPENEGAQETPVSIHNSAEASTPPLLLNILQVRFANRPKGSRKNNFTF